MARLEAKKGVVEYNIVLSPDEMDVLRDIFWMDVGVVDADACGIRPLLRHIFGAEYGTKGNSVYRGRKL
ncbi:MAG: hypothetical protein ACQ5SW_09645 [Sphaerochaetaceae bacterium]